MHKHSPCIRKQAIMRNWRAADTLCGELQGTMRNWLLDQGSLTSRLVAKSAGDFRVEVLSQYWGRAEFSEAKVLGISAKARVLVREVVLWGNGKPWVFARSILPYQSLEGPLRHLGKFDSRPLGAFLFSQPTMQRGPMQVRSFRPAAKELPQGLSPNLPSWGRRSVFFVHDKPLLVSEVFLESFIESL